MAKVIPKLFSKVVLLKPRVMMIDASGGRGTIMDIKAKAKA